MFTRFFGAPIAVWLLSAASLCGAADVEYVEVRDEPNHIHKFENEDVRVYDAQVPAGHVTLYHRHSENTIYVVVDPSRLKTQAVEGRPTEREFRAKTVFYNPQREHPLIHEVTNVGDTDARLIAVEFRGKAREAAHARTTAHGYSEGLVNEFVRVNMLALEPGERTSPHVFHYPTVTVALTPGVVTRESKDSPTVTETVEPGEVTYRADGVSHDIRNDGSEAVEFVVYECVAE